MYVIHRVNVGIVEKTKLGINSSDGIIELFGRQLIQEWNWYYRI